MIILELPAGKAKESQLLDWQQQEVAQYGEKAIQAMKKAAKKLKS